MLVRFWKKKKNIKYVRTTLWIKIESSVVRFVRKFELRRYTVNDANNRFWKFQATSPRLRAAGRSEARLWKPRGVHDTDHLEMCTTIASVLPIAADSFPILFSERRVLLSKAGSVRTAIYIYIYCKIWKKTRYLADFSRRNVTLKHSRCPRMRRSRTDRCKYTFFFQKVKVKMEYDRVTTTWYRVNAKKHDKTAEVHAIWNEFVFQI